MKIIKVISNNAVVSIDELGNEIVVMGSGIGFKKKVDSIIDKSCIEKIYKMSSENASRFENLITNLPSEHIDIADEIINYAKKVISTELKENIYITLTDHISFAIKRKEQDMEFNNALLWEIKQFYPKEFEIGLKALDIIEKAVDFKLSEDEAGFIALHIVNAQYNLDMSNVAKSPKMINDILNIVKETFNIEYDTSSISYERFVTHLKFLTQRIIGQKKYDGDDEEFYRAFLEKCKQSADCARLINKYISEDYEYELSEEELMYLAMHIERIVKRQNI